MDVAEQTGELGFWFDPGITRLVQTGVELAHFPNAHLFGVYKVLQSRHGAYHFFR
jgi:hypothetical protein